jgi:hypothetical protein
LTVTAKAYTVTAVPCHHQAPDEEIYQQLCRATDPLTPTWDKIANAKTVVIKANMAHAPSDITRLPVLGRTGTGAGRRQELVDESVLRATLRLLRERTAARIIATDTEVYAMIKRSPQNELNYLPILEEYGVEFVHANRQPLVWAQPPGGGLMFGRYLLASCIVEADAFVSLAKMKNHLFQGVTLSLKNLFGLPPMTPEGRSRTYFHHIIRLSYVLADLGKIANPCLNIVDGLVGQAGREWGGQGRITNTLMAGDHTIATDACGAWLMGHDPNTDWPDQPFLRDRSALRVAAENGFGTTNLDEIDFRCEVQGPVAEFLNESIDPPEVIANWRRTTCEQALYYRDNAERFYSQYAGQIIMLQDGEVRWSGADPSESNSRRVLAAGHTDSALWMKLVDPEEKEQERYGVYERELPHIMEVQRQQ